MTPVISDRVHGHAGATPTAIVARSKLRGVWVETSWAELDAQVTATARALLSIGGGETVAILAENSLDWVVADLGIQDAGAVVLPLSTQASVTQLADWLRERSVTTVFCGDQEHVDKVLEADAGVTTVIAFDATGLSGYGSITVLSVAELRTAASADGGASPSAHGVAAAQPTDAGLVEISALGAMEEAAHAIRVLGLTASDRVVAIAPFSDAATRVTDVYATLAARAQLHFPETLTSVPDDLEEISPTLLSGPPRVFELIHRESRTKQRETGRLRQRLIRWALGGTPPTRASVRSFLVTRAIAARHGLVHTRLALVTGNERLPRSTEAFLLSLGVPVVNAAPTPAPGSPEFVEGELRENECVRRAVVLGTTTVIELDFDATALWATENAIDFGTRSSLATHPAVVALIAADVRRVDDLSGSPNTVRVVIAPREFSVAAEELTPYLAVNRDAVRSSFEDSSPVLDAGVQEYS